MNPATGCDAWDRCDRMEFWESVRLRMVVRRLRQSDVAAAIALDRASLSRRLSGRVHQRPSAWMVDRLITVLRLAPADAQRLHRLAGTAACDTPAACGAAAPGGARSRNDLKLWERVHDAARCDAPSPLKPGVPVRLCLHVTLWPVDGRPERWQASCRVTLPDCGDP
jgi:hypothetical protein